jgi:hypothetical protein
VTQVTSDAIEIESIRKVDAVRPVIAIECFGTTVAFILAEEDAVFFPAYGGERRLRLHDGAILCPATNGKRLLTGGDDGRVVATNGCFTKPNNLRQEHR